MDDIPEDDGAADEEVGGRRRSMKTDTSEKGLEALIVGYMTAGGGWIAGNPKDYDRSYAVDLVQLACIRSRHATATGRCVRPR